MLGFGVSGPHATRFVHKMDTVALIAQALSAGVEFFDTAPFYGDGEAERRLGFTLSASDLPVFVSTKAGTLKDGSRWRKDFAPDAIERSLDDSLSRLEQVDALFLHGPAPEDLSDALLAKLQSLKSDGRIRFVGVCGRGAELNPAIDAQAFDLLMAPASTEIEQDLQDTLTRAKTSGLGVVGIEAMGASVRGVRPLRRPSDIWYAARAIVRRDRRDTKRSPLGRLADAISQGPADLVVISTTRSKNLASNLSVAQNAFI